MFRSALTQEMFVNCLTSKQLQELNNESSIVHLEKGQLVFTEQGIPFGCYFLLKGKVKLYKKGIFGKQQIFQICRDGDFFGFHPVLNQSRYPDSAELLEPSRLMMIPAAFFKQLLEENNTLCLTMLKALSTEFERFIGQETMLSQKSVFERVCTVLFYLTDLYTEGSTIHIPLSRNDLADLSGTVKETLVRVLHDLKERKIIETIDNKGTIQINDVEKLRLLGDALPGAYQ